MAREAGCGSEALIGQERKGREEDRKNVKRTARARLKTGSEDKNKNKTITKKHTANI